MNIFAIEGTDNNIDWVKSAQSQDNYRVVKMILESTQMLCCTLNELAGEQITPYRSTHKNHPSTKWVRESSANFESLVEHKSDNIIESYRKFYASKPRMRYPKDKVPQWFADYRGTQRFEVI